MWSYRLTYDTLFAPNPLWEVLTLATCKPVIRKSLHSVEGTWIAGWTACSIHNSEIYGGVDKCQKTEEKLVYLARIDEKIPLDEYWNKFAVKRNKPTPNNKYDARNMGDNIYHLGDDGTIIQERNLQGHNSPEDIKRDFKNGKNALICKKFFYFTRDNRVNIDPKYRPLVYGSKGQKLFQGSLVDEFIEYIETIAKERGVKKGIIGELHIQYPSNLWYKELPNETTE